MQKEYYVEGMTCGNCVAKVKGKLESLEVVETAVVQLAPPQANLTLNKQIPVEQLQATIAPYKIKEVPMIVKDETLSEKGFLQTYKPLLLIVAFITGVSLLVQYPFEAFSGMLWMRHFMAGFFLVFAFFKLLNMEGFASSYQMYDIVAAKWKGWGYLYPFVELGLGVLYLLNIAPELTSIVTLVVLGVSSVGVIKSNLDKQKIKCACLGDVFNLPMSTVTVVEDLAMVAMAAMMLVFG